MALDYLRFVEEHTKDQGMNWFEKVIIASQRAKDLYEQEDKHPGTILHNHKPTYQAILEINEKRLKLHYPTEEELAAELKLRATKKPGTDDFTEESILTME